MSWLRANIQRRKPAGEELTKPTNNMGGEKKANKQQGGKANKRHKQVKRGVSGDPTVDERRIGLFLWR